VLLAAIGDVNSPRTWSGIPYHLLQAGRAAGFLHEGLDLSVDSPSFRLRRAAWNASRFGLGFDRPGGFQYSEGFLEILWAPIRERVRGSVLINCFQLFAPSVVQDPSVAKWFYIDMTLRQLFEDYGVGRRIGAGIREQALRREAEGFRAAEGVICHSGWAARSVAEHYGIDPRRVHVVVPGASLDIAVYEAWEQSAKGGKATAEGAPVRLVFVGRDWRRKGLDRLLQAYVLARKRGAGLSLRIIGCQPAALPEGLRQAPDVEWVGFVDKTRDAQRFLGLVAECDLGCHLSWAEAGGIAQREFHALGLGVLGTDVGGAPEHRFPDASIGVPADATPGAIADVLCDLACNPGRLAAMKSAAWERRREATWQRSVERLRAIIGG
jgi:glycosyltransferase involved in cell wall biosynthesis